MTNETNMAEEGQPSDVSVGAALTLASQGGEHAAPAQIQWTGWQLRVVEEYTELRAKLDRLRVFLQSEAYARLDNIDQELLEQQAWSMEDYLVVLQQRIDRFSHA
jgi:hypothetical protein